MSSIGGKVLAEFLAIERDRIEVVESAEVREGSRPFLREVEVVGCADLDLRSAADSLELVDGLFEVWIVASVVFVDVSIAKESMRTNCRRKNYTVAHSCQIP